MTQADIDEMLKNLAETTRYLRETSRLVRASAEHVGEVSVHLATMSEHLTEVINRIDATITAGLTHLHGEGDGAPPFTETHRLTLEMQMEVRGDYPDRVLSDAIAAALAEIDRRQGEIDALSQAVQQELETHHACQPRHEVMHHSDQIVGFHLGLHWVQSLMRKEP